MSIDYFTTNLIDSYLKDGIKKLEFEESMMQTLFVDQKYDLILYALEKGFELTVDIFNRMIASGQIKLYQYLYGRGIPMKASYLDIVIELNQIDTFQWLYGFGIPIYNDSFDLMIKLGRLDLLQIVGLDYPNFKMAEDKWRKAIESGNLELVKWLYTKTNFEPIRKTTAIYYGHLNILQWITQIDKSDWTSWDLECAGLCGKIEILEWLWQQGCPLDQNTCFSASNRGNLEALKWLHEHNISYSISEAAACAIRNGHIKILEYLLSQGLKIENEMCRFAVSNNQVASLKWLIEHGCFDQNNLPKLKQIARDPEMIIYLLSLEK